LGGIFDKTLVKFDKALTKNRGKSAVLAELCSEFWICVQSKDMHRQGHFGKSQITALLDHCKTKMRTADHKPPSLE